MFVEVVGGGRGGEVVVLVAAVRVRRAHGDLLAPRPARWSQPIASLGPTAIFLPRPAGSWSQPPIASLGPTAIFMAPEDNKG